MKTIICADCGKEVERRHPRQKYCPECAAGKKPESLRSQPSGDIYKKSLSDIALEARALGLSYGEYVSAVNSGKLKQILIARGITGAKANSLIRKAYAEKEKRISRRTA